MPGIPPEFIRGPNDFASVDMADLIAADVRNVLGKRRADPTTPGDYRWRQDFGTRMDRFLYLNNNDALIGRVQAELSETFARWLTDLVLVNVNVSRQKSNPQKLGDNVLVVSVQYRSRGRREIQEVEVMR